METDNNKYRGFNQIVNLIYNEAIEDLEEKKEKKNILKDKVTLELKFICDSVENNLQIEVYVGNSIMYKIKKLSEFYDRMILEQNYKYDEKLEFVHSKKNFKESSLPILEFVVKYAEIIKYGNKNSNTNYRFGATALSESKIIIDHKALDEVFEILKGKTVYLKKDLEEKKVKFVNENPDVKFYLKKIGNDEYSLSTNIDVQKIYTFKGFNYTYLLIDNVMYRCDNKFKNTTMKILDSFKKIYSTEVKLGKNQLSQLFSIIMPKIENNFNIEDRIKKEIKDYYPKKLKSRIYLDFDKNNNLIADMKFVYDGIEYNPLENSIKKLVSRNIIEETKTLNILRKTQFMLDSKNLKFVLTDDEKIYEFIKNELEEYTKNFEVLATENFKAKKIKQPKISNLDIKINNNLLEIDLKNLNIDTRELAEIMKNYKLKKKYYRLKDGTFLNLDKNENIEFLGKLITGADVDYNKLDSGIIHLPVYRTMYLNQLLEGLKKTKIKKNDEYYHMVNNLNKDSIINRSDIPTELNNVLRYYQKSGFEWLKNLDYYNFGGILADDMGLGKTIQLLAVILSYVDKTDEQHKKTSIVISPSSLALNWESEANKFTPTLKTLVISGSAFERKKQINSIDDYDLVITSYDLLKRDIEYYKEKKYNFKYIIADEAQYLKNSNTQNAIAIKQIKGETRYALTGTPMENSLSELWSIFDFIMPGYLFSHKRFKNSYEAPIVKEKDEDVMKKLKMLIEPFVLRRTKKEVLQELPDKTITILKSSMQEEQNNIYLSYLLEAKQEVKESIDINGLEKSHMKILAVLTRLRQICCHPSVFIENYDGGSSKLDQCMELIRDGINSGHKILLFSGYTSIFPIIEKELEEKNINYFKLTGSTKVSERIKLVNEFNSNKDIKLFLISLKAGGTGLNLTGADMVIHYDPWWNASAENQATDRAHRIGQKNNVQVYKLITKNSIEEKIYQMQQKKSALIDNMLTINTSFVNKLSKEEIMELFE